jgi:hypothetical protein
MAWVYLFGLALLLWVACGTVMAVGRRLWGLDAALKVHLAAAPITAFLVAAAHVLIAPGFGSLLRAMAITALVVVLDALIVAPILEHSYAMFRSVIGTWLPFALIFFASLAAGLLLG